MKHQTLNLFSKIFLPCMLLISACSDERGESEVVTGDNTEAVTGPNSFIQFENNQASLAAGEYTVVAATNLSGESGSYQLEVELDVGSKLTFEGSWTNSGGLDALDNNNPRHTIFLPSAGGIKINIDSTINSYLYLLRNNHVIAESEQTIELTDFKINSKEYAQAYFKAVDPNDLRTNLADWQSLNGFDNQAVTHVTFRDARDLGYGRDMYAVKHDDGRIAVYVDNYVVQLSDDDASSYNSLNLDAAIDANAKYHIGSNAMEFSPIDESDPDSEKIIKIFTFSPKDVNGNQDRATSADLDGRGEKFMPTMCLACHGGRLYPLNTDGSFRIDSLRSAKMNILHPETFEYSSVSGFSQTELEPGIKIINQMVHATYLDMAERADEQQGKWDADFALEISAGAYGGDFSAEEFDSTFVPSGWQQTGFRPDGVEVLYTQVVEPHCVACHSLRGSNTAEEYVSPSDFNGQQVQLANAISFSSYEKFISYKEEIIEKVYRRGRMPMSLLNYDLFWETPQNQATLLASFLPGFNVFEDSGEIGQPSYPVPLAGADRSSTSPVQLDASGSLMTTNYSWTIINAPDDSDAELSQPETATPILTASVSGEYVLQLIATNSNDLTTTDEVKITIDNELSPSSQELTFVDDIRPVLNDSFSGESCASCHEPDSRFTGVPVYYDDSNLTLYQNVLERVNFDEPENSILLRKPTSIQHGGRIRLDRTVEQGDLNYQTILNWIRNGAPCGDDPVICH